MYDNIIYLCIYIYIHILYLRCHGLCQLVSSPTFSRGSFLAGLPLSSPTSLPGSQLQCLEDFLNLKYWADELSIWLTIIEFDYNYQNCILLVIVG